MDLHQSNISFDSIQQRIIKIKNDKYTHSNFILASKCLFEFMNAVNNYDLYDSKLIKYGTCVCLSYENLDFDSLTVYYNEFEKIIVKEELYGSNDLLDPIKEIYQASKIYI